MKVLTLTSLFPNSEQPFLGQFIKERIRHLANLCELKVVAPVPYFPPIKHINNKWYKFSRIPFKEYIDGLEVYHPRYFLIPKFGMSFYGYFFFLSIHSFMKRLRETFRYDVIDAHWAYPDAYAAVSIGQRLDVPVCVSLRGSDINEYLQLKIIRHHILSSLKRADKIISVSRALKKIIVRYGIPENKIIVVPNGVDKNAFYYIEKTKARDRLKLPLNAKVVLNIGNLVKGKRQDLLINSIAEVKKTIKELRCFIIGIGNEEKNLRKLILRLGLKRCVFLLPPIPNKELVWWYNAADVFCLTSESEGCPNVILESLSCGLPTVATAVGGIPELVSNKRLGLLVQKMNTEELSISLTCALNKSWKREVISQGPKIRTWEVVAEEIMENIRGLQ